MPSSESNLPESGSSPPSLNPAMTAKRRPAAIIFVFITVVLDMLALGIIVPVLPKLVVTFLGGNLEQGTKVYGYFGFIWAAMQFGAAPVLGALSDRFGRRPVILISNFGLGLDYILMALSPNLGWLFAGRIISGITAGSVPTASAYIADVTPPEKRAGAFGMIGAAFGIGFILGPALGGVLGEVNPRLPFWFAAILSLANACYGLFVLPESLPRERRAPFAWSKANPVASLTLLRSHPELFGMAAVIFLYYLAHEVFPNVYVLYAAFRFQWDERTIGLTLGTAGVCSALVQAALTKRVVARLGERGAIFAGSLFGVLGFALYGLSTRGWIFWLAVPLGSLWGLASPATQAIMSRRISPSEQGRLQGAYGSLRGITGMIGPILFTWTFAAFLPNGAAGLRGWQLPGAPFLLAALMVAAGLAVAWAVTRRNDDAGKLEPDAQPPPAFTSELS